MTGIAATDLDDLYWLPNWTPREESDFEQRILKVLERDEWIISGNYTRFSDKHVRPQADLVIWLDMPLHTLLYRAVLRSLCRCWKKEPCCNGNYETLRRLFFSRYSIVVWILSTYRRRRRRLAKRTDLVRIRSQKELENFLSKLKKD